MESYFSLHWGDYVSHITDAFGSLLHKEDLVDVTLSCEGKKIKAHKMLLSACSPYFHSIFKENPCQHPVIVFRNVNFSDLQAVVEFIYCGEVNVLQEHIESFLNTAEMLEVKGLSVKGDEAIELKEINRTEGEIIQNSLRREPKACLRKQVSTSESPEGSDSSSPVANRSKLSIENPSDESSLQREVTLVVKDIDFVDVSELEAELPESSQDKAHVQDAAMEEGNKMIGNDQTTEDESIIGEEISSLDVQLLEPKTVCIPIKKRKNIPEDEAYLKSGISSESEKKTVESKCVAILKAKRSRTDKITAVKEVVKIPMGLIVTSTKCTSQVQDLFDFPNQGPQDEALRSEEATTPVHDEQISYSQDTPVCKEVPSVEPEIAEEAPSLQEEKTEADVPSEEEPKEPEFDYFGCEICRTEAKPVDLDRISFNNKCPICPFVCFCQHLLKDHMRVIHGWFNVQRRFTHY